MSELKLFILNNKRIFVTISFIVFFLILILICYSNFNSKNESLVQIDNIYKDIYTENEFDNILKEEKVENIVKEEFISVDIKGRIKKPGVYQISKTLDRRISDVVTMAGGFLNDADTSVTNLAKKIFDEMVIIIYSKDEVKEFSKIKEKEEIQNNVCINECDSCIEKDNVVNDNEIAKEEQSDEIILININKANKDELMTLPGIGESKALAIIEYRNNKLFEKIEDIMNISGIKESAFEKIKDFITV